MARQAAICSRSLPSLSHPEQVLRPAHAAKADKARRRTGSTYSQAAVVAKRRRLSFSRKSYHSASSGSIAATGHSSAGLPPPLRHCWGAQLTRHTNDFTAESVQPASVLACELPLPPQRGQAGAHGSSDGYGGDDRGGVWQCPSADGAQDSGKAGWMSFWAHPTWRCPFSAGIINIHLRDSRRHTAQGAQQLYGSERSARPHNALWPLSRPTNGRSRTAGKLARRKSLLYRLRLAILMSSWGSMLSASAQSRQCGR
jgi:hypothetical protein